MDKGSLRISANPNCRCKSRCRHRPLRLIQRKRIGGYFDSSGQNSGQIAEMAHKLGRRCLFKTAVFDRASCKHFSASNTAKQKQKSPQSQWPCGLDGTLHQKRYFAFFCYREHFLLHKPGVKMMTRGLFHFSGNLIE